ncbi:hypothetical protein XELAEV_18033236mg [Xenopus laevis]|uniref:Uncharacterized protein n=1 Tax=Xenopus laevis TaxID=8355 RepID=A0A974CLA3_XENLA|nr:hypothetical protein XELAEV_18033236mg [Xenopus laevis]
MVAILRVSARVAGQRRRRVQRALQLKLQRASVEESSMSDSDQGSCRAIVARMPLGMLKDTSSRYTWGGVFAEKVSDTGDSVMVPVCGRCRHKAYPAFHDVRGRCPHCQHSCWICPYVDEKIQGSPQAVLGLIALKRSDTSQRVIIDLPEEETPLEGSTPHVREVPEVSIPPESAPALPAAVEGIIVAIEPEERPRQEICQGSSQDAEKRIREGRTSPPYFKASGKKGPCHAKQGASSGWEDPSDEAEEDEATNKPLFKLLHSFWAPKKITLAEEKNFWVVPGCAKPEIFCRVSRVQRVINFRVYRKWGYYMPYTPLWVFEPVENLLDEWVVEEIVAKEKTIGNALSHPDKAKCAAAWSFVWSLENEWWCGRTILHHAVHSCGKKNPVPCYLTVDVPLPVGGTVEKPHPKYYISYEDTKMWFTYMI